MSYTISMRAGSKAEAKEKTADEFDKVAFVQPAHMVERAAVLGAADAFIDLLPDDPARDLSLTLSGWVATSAVDQALTSATFSISLVAVDRPPAPPVSSPSPVLINEPTATLVEEPAAAAVAGSPAASDADAKADR